MCFGLEEIGISILRVGKRVEEVLFLFVDKRIFNMWLILCFKNDEYDVIYVL